MPAIPVLLYHSVADRPGRRVSRWTVTPAAFAAHIDMIAACGCTGLTVTGLAACLRGEQALPQRPVVVTFDDGYADVVEAVGALAARGLPATVYVPTTSLGAAGRLSSSALVDLARLPRTEIGAHGVVHQRLDELPDAALAAEVTRSKAALEALIEAPVTSFAYPHGAYDRRARHAVIDAGYVAAAAVKNALSHTGDDPFAIARWTVTSEASPDAVGAVLDGDGAPLAWRRERVRTRASRTVRRLKRRALDAH
jgi:peptidoglycan/xylan/chitin deacetylase (PgdA/CDA1 family)